MNTKKEALESASLISKIAEGERVLLMPNDTKWKVAKDLLVCVAFLEVINSYINSRIKYYEEEFATISNITIIDPDPKVKHSFSNSCYQEVVRQIVEKYRHR